MELSKEQENVIVKNVIEKVLTLMPEVIGNLMSSVSAQNKLKKEFFEANPEFKGHEKIIASVVEGEEGKDLSLNYKEIFANAVPEIKKRISLAEKLNFTDISEKKDLDFATKADDSFGEL